MDLHQQLPPKAAALGANAVCLIKNNISAGRAFEKSGELTGFFTLDDSATWRDFLPHAAEL